MTRTCFLFSVVTFTIVMLLIMSVAAIRAEEPEMMTTDNTQTIAGWIVENNPICDDRDKRYTPLQGNSVGFRKLLTGGATLCMRYRPWVCAETGEHGVDVEPLPSWICN